MPDTVEAEDLALGFALAMGEGEPEPKTDPEPKADPEPKTDPEPKADPEPKTDPEPDPALLAAQEEARKATERATALEAEKAERERIEREKPVELTAEEKAAVEEAEAAIATVEKDWPDVAKAMRVLLDRQKKDLTEFSEKRLKELQEQMAPALTTAEQAARDKFMAPIAAAHPDHEEIALAPEGQKSKLVTWIETLPKREQIGALTVLEHGTPQDVVDLLTDYKKANNLTDDPAEAARKQEQEAARAQEEAEKKKRLAKMEGVRTTPSNRAGNAADPDDFAGGFAEALKMGA